MSNPIIRIIAAVAQNGVIGKDGKTPWHLSEDLQRFKWLTFGRPVIMGRKTFEAIGHPLPDRINAVLTHHKDLGEEVRCVSSIEEAIQIYYRQNTLCVIGGAEVYQQALPFADELALTEIMQDFEGDTFFPELPPEWKKTWSSPVRMEENGIPYCYTTWRRFDRDAQ